MALSYAAFTYALDNKHFSILAVSLEILLFEHDCFPKFLRFCLVASDTESIELYHFCTTFIGALVYQVFPK